MTENTSAAEVAQTLAQDPPASPLISVGELLHKYPHLREPVIEGLLRRGETMNVIAPPKTGKSWLSLDMAMCVATGRPWLGTFSDDRWQRADHRQ